MADGINLAVNISGILQVVGNIAQLSYRHAGDDHRAPITHKRYWQEASSLMEVLLLVEQAIQDIEAAGILLPRPHCLNGDVMTELHLELQKRNSTLTWPFQEKEVSANIDMLQRYRSLFAGFLCSCMSWNNKGGRDDCLIANPRARSKIFALIDSLLKHAPAPETVAMSRNRTLVPILPGLSQMDGQVLGSFVGLRTTSIAINKLLEERASRAFQVLYFFADFSSRGQQRTHDILLCLLRQLIEYGSSETIATLKEPCQDPAKLANVNQVAHLIMIASSIQPIYMVLDAPEELEDPSELLETALSLVALGIQAIGGDMKLYVESRIQESDLADEICQSGFINDIVSKSNNRFLLARFILDEVLGLDTVCQIQKALTRSPLGIRPAIDATMKRIVAQSESQASLVPRLLAWITHAKRPLRVEEIACAFAVDDTQQLKSENTSTYLPLRERTGLVVVDKVDNTLGLVHYSVYEYFRERVFSENDTSMDMARTSLKYLSMGHLTMGPCKSHGKLMERFSLFPFLDYSAKHWGHHIIGKKAEAKLEMLMTRLLDNRGFRDNAFQALQYTLQFSDGRVGKELFNTLPQHQEPLHMAVYWGLAYTFTILLRRGEFLHSADSHGWTPLHWACFKRHIIIAKLLVRKGADVNSKDVQGWTPLFWAAYLGNLPMTRFVLSRGANYLLRSTQGWTALHWAVSQGHVDIAQELLEHHSKTRFTEPALCRRVWEEIKSDAESTRPIQVAADADDETLA
ncbi:hypothetical protein BO78DRAFT_424389 [Aspergillus sclerotiicarbonarius CBS 121057]|uniref:Uncharacterized protein n=1 Tax=Aspergillus sclerotiicarbonarius (strain CBS 121057 / IBT 28362) TaxID=1448318 RepID=A0A319DS37_ASPSB|nr:hypothetical protein BO78DRAFT_424389 [Aspergillus sclerotiicarbonarius CBS 121057]